MFATRSGAAVAVAAAAPAAAGRIAAIVPVLDEERRLAPCLEGLVAQDASLAQIVVVDGGSRDGTRELVRTFAARDPRVVLVDAAPVPAGWNGKAWGLASGLAASDPGTAWIVTIDADVRPGPHLAPSLLAHAVRTRLDAFSAAPLLELSGAAEALLHPALLATIVYRFGLPGNVARTPQEVQANGQCFLAKRSWLVRTQAFAAARRSRCDDVTIVRTLVAAGARVGFYEGSALASVSMYAGFRECWRNWPRSLGMRDAMLSDRAFAASMAVAFFAGALPPAVVAATLATGGATGTFFFRTNLVLTLARLGVLAGMRRAYGRVAPTYWLSPLFDILAIARILAASLDAAPTWRGRTLVSERKAA